MLSYLRRLVIMTVSLFSLVALGACLPPGTPLPDMVIQTKDGPAYLTGSEFHGVARGQGHHYSMTRLSLTLPNGEFVSLEVSTLSNGAGRVSISRYRSIEGGTQAVGPTETENFSHDDISTASDREAAKFLTQQMRENHAKRVQNEIDKLLPRFIGENWQPADNPNPQWMPGSAPEEETEQAMEETIDAVDDLGTQSLEEDAGAVENVDDPM